MADAFWGVFVQERIDEQLALVLLSRGKKQRQGRSIRLTRTQTPWKSVKLVKKNASIRSVLRRACYECGGWHDC